MAQLLFNIVWLEDVKEIPQGLKAWDILAIAIDLLYPKIPEGKVTSKGTGVYF